jgi:hypothetical protein
MYKVFAVLCWTALLAGTGYAQDRHQERVDAITRKYSQDVRDVVEAANKIDLDLQKYGQKSQYTEQARQVARSIVGTKAWKDLSSHGTKRSLAATAVIDKAIELANTHLFSGRKELAALEDAANAEWAKTHPADAKLADVQRRLQAAEDAAKTAARKAQEAEESAERARRDAQRRPEYINVTPPPPPRKPGHVTIDMRPDQDKDGDKQDEPGTPIRPPQEPPSRRVTVSGKGAAPSGASR